MSSATDGSFLDFKGPFVTFIIDEGWNCCLVLHYLHANGGIMSLKSSHRSGSSPGTRIHIRNGIKGRHDLKLKDIQHDWVWGACSSGRVHVLSL